MDFRKLINKLRSRHTSYNSNEGDQLSCNLDNEDCPINSASGSVQESENEGKVDIDIDWQQIIGYGNFSVVYVGFLKSVKEPVAVKIPMVWDDSEDYSRKNVLKEVSIMETIGKHENVIEILGCRNISDSFVNHQSTLCIITPLCVNGSLQKYLRSKPIDTTIIEDDRIDHAHLNCKQKVASQAEGLVVMNFYELLKFSYEIAQGMTYLSSKKVVHGDLAARNILLDLNKTCKITDFGMSYIISNKSPPHNIVKENTSGNERRSLAWRWMAIECLEGNDISFQSDVWAYGVTLWEIFTIGDAPFPRHSFDDKFVQNLKARLLQLQKPKYASTQIYDLMLECWNPSPASRPSFQSLANLFHKLLEKIQPLQSKIPNIKDEQPLLKIRHKQACLKDDSCSQPHQFEYNISLGHGAMRDNASKAILLMYGLKNVKFANKYSANMFFEEIDGQAVCVRRCGANSERGICKIKALAIVGDHPNVAKFIGMFYDDDLITGVKHLNIVTEFYHNRSLEEYFQRKPEEDYNENSINNNGDNIFRLVCKFAADIARGMEFISSKQIVQGDLSSDMIFLDGNLTCKIHLSHMARTVEDNEIYIKTTPDHVSWRILAVETLKRLEFSMKTDIWSFGITVWEIFSVGTKPYENFQYSDDFPELLATGFRLPKPKIGSKEIYSMLLKCWNNEPKHRPSFTQLAMFFEGIVSQHYYLEVE
ncbi:unnamed protein product [Orchesella dallaii]|uniref:Protein kinase domain-containing protein n=1 Tax=Orchesella dallaii TaxID=48710 RepID=A0ABP1QHW0_9HEXA